ncbi:hypothetical protein A3A75_05345 [Candidatus Woesebacteria bacterium RIFCSPLOWO2_01_FULL_39_10]|uniref:SCP domain-containing protein n=1 Tax=Candidatus Woesebacteria bacterium RIFCSPLOWO2_01_FULL_39_10 TaxID=1802516 RepID=A0A1F8B4W4_9BACT|nr:MAG: hypothetical protein A3A75_05345 [Candidatus Woesebacteria bacterium RIFCSPLOWO2_01_FULL_39_10]
MNLSNFQANWVDLIIIAILLYFVSEAWRVGFWIILADFIGFLLSLVVALRVYKFPAELLRSNFSISHSLANAIGFLVTAAFTEAIVSFLLVRLIKKIPYKFWKKPWNNLAAIIPAAGQGIILLSFILTLAISLPIAPRLKKDVTQSTIGGYLVRQTSGFESRVNEIFGGLVEDSLTYFTIRPGSEESVPITVETQELTVDEEAEREMFKLVNEERKSRGISELTWRSDVVPVARDHAQDMWEREYFGHYSPEGEDAGNRMEKAGVEFMIVGENLALAPTLSTAHQGLMNSEGHRKNILDTEFKRVGIGVIDNGFYGKMFVQLFTD